jgi:hypothetical protein
MNGMLSSTPNQDLEGLTKLLVRRGSTSILFLSSDGEDDMVTINFY